jgi:hypothetical protein
MTTLQTSSDNKREDDTHRNDNFSVAYNTCAT